MESNCILHGNTLERLEATLGDIKDSLSNIRVDVGSTSTQLKMMNGSVARAIQSIDEHEKWLKSVQSTLDTAKGLGTGAAKWIGVVVVLSNALVSSIVYALTRGQ